MILTIRTDKPIAEISLYDQGIFISGDKWEAHRQLASTIHSRIDTLIENKGLDLHELDGIIYFEGPGSFTGLRIGAALVNALRESLPVKTVAAKGGNWIVDGHTQLQQGKNYLVSPFYGRDPHITTPKK